MYAPVGGWGWPLLERVQQYLSTPQFWLKFDDLACVCVCMTLLCLTVVWPVLEFHVSSRLSSRPYQSAGDTGSRRVSSSIRQSFKGSRISTSFLLAFHSLVRHQLIVAKCHMLLASARAYTLVSSPMDELFICHSNVLFRAVEPEQRNNNVPVSNNQLLCSLTRPEWTCWRNARALGRLFVASKNIIIVSVNASRAYRWENRAIRH